MLQHHFYSVVLHILKMWLAPSSSNVHYPVTSANLFKIRNTIH